MNMAAYRGVYLWEVAREGAGMTMKAAGNSLELLQACAEKTGCALEVLSYGGLPVFLGRFGRRQVWTAGLLCFAASWPPGSPAPSGTGWPLFLSLISYSVPGFFLCLAGIALFAVTLGWLPARGMYTAGSFTSLADLLRHLILPAGVVCLSSLGELVKQTRAACLEALGQDYIVTARAKGLTEGAVMVRHAFRGSLVPVLTTIPQSPDNQIAHLAGCVSGIICCAAV